jgi:hypothetical protein
MDKYIKIILGILIVLAGLYYYIGFGSFGPSAASALWIIIKGSIGLVVVFIGGIFVLLGATE